MKITSVLIIGMLLGSILTTHLNERVRKNLVDSASNLMRVNFIQGCVRAKNAKFVIHECIDLANLHREELTIDLNKFIIRHL